MIDDSDLDFTILASGGSGGGCIRVILSLIAIGLVWYFVAQNKQECAAMHCGKGTPELMNHKCLCAEEAR